MRFSNKFHPNQNFFRLYAFIPSEPSSLRKMPALSTSSSGSSSSLHFGLRSVQIKLSSYVKNQVLGGSFCRIPSKFVIESLVLSRHSCHSVCNEFGWPSCGKMVRYFSVSSSNSSFASGSVVKSEKNYRLEFVLEVVGMIRSNGEDLERRLNMMRPRLNAYTITEIFEFLNSEKVHGLRFFEWIWSNDPKLQKDSCVCSLIIDNLGRLEDYGTMQEWFRKFACENICLTYEAFGFLPVLASADASLKESTKIVLDLLNEVGGSFQSSGVCALIEMFCKFHLFEMAKNVISISGSKQSCSLLFVREMCRSGLIEEAHGIIRGMRQARCAHTTTVYNYLLGSLWKNSRITEVFQLVDEMKKSDIPFDAITFEILINSVCSLGNMDSVHRILDQMVAQGVQPRLSTHACIIKTLFAAERYEAAYKHVVYASAVDKTSSNTIYSLMAKLYSEKGHIMSARNTLVDMMEKGLRPNFSIYIKVVKQLRRTGRGNLARDLESKHFKFVFNPHLAYSNFVGSGATSIFYQQKERCCLKADSTLLVNNLKDIKVIDWILRPRTGPPAPSTF
ncbi:pentatricopeptide repeat-containing protein At1g74900, mitochondrial-like isoform X3 [Salvia hispanica]|uniref:pentatricopeptide repeat-containing protein At1g74900, mitochondrial-like isoform X3 n=1 Tax=Salvia hispanica TaxID=49212 RepID=UPI002008EF8E|nr:pentatricopeptide repeat-containing protein At1g74900, mitochondrial-like isoform X3 [Salvia hispanica]